MCFSNIFFRVVPRAVFLPGCDTLKGQFKFEIDSMVSVTVLSIKISYGYQQFLSFRLTLETVVLMTPLSFDSTVSTTLLDDSAVSTTLLSHDLVVSTTPMSHDSLVSSAI